MSKKHRQRQREQEKKKVEQHPATLSLPETRDCLCQQDIGTCHCYQPQEVKHPFWERLLTSSAFYTTVATIVIAYATVTYTCYSGKQLNVLKNSFRISQGAYVSIGKKDGTVADFIFPVDPTKNAGIVIYFQNNGHLPAKFNWGLIMPISTTPPAPEFPELKSVHKFTPMTKTKNKKDGSIAENSAQIIPADSLYVADVVELPQERARKQMAVDSLFEIIGAYEWCDTLGNYSCRQFWMFYQGEPFKRFALVNDLECFPGVNQPKPDPTVDYLPPCDTSNNSKK